tara:strand:+ start:191 stop:499 length:309 start_codon:yes stop_codon:yes gene_type:complete
MTVRNETERMIETSDVAVMSANTDWQLGHYVAGDTVRIESIRVTEYDIDEYHFHNVHVEHSGDWRVYGDAGFEAAISRILGYEVHWSEQGAQQSHIAHLEVA